MSQDQIELRRQAILEINQEISRLINHRTRLALEVLAYKSQLALPLHLPERESEMLRELTANNAGPLDDETLSRVFAIVFEAARRLHQERLSSSTS